MKIGNFFKISKHVLFTVPHFLWNFQIWIVDGFYVSINDLLQVSAEFLFSLNQLSNDGPGENSISLS